MKTLSRIVWAVFIGAMVAYLLWIAASVIEVNVKHHDSAPTYSAANFFEVMDGLRGKIILKKSKNF